MALTEKYESLIDMARRSGAANLNVQDNGDTLSVEGTVASETEKQQLWDEYNRLDPDMRSGDLILNISVAEAASGSGGGGASGEEYEVRSGDSLSKIAGRYEGVSWKEIFEANRDILDDPDEIKPGQRLKIPNRTA